MNVSAKKWFLVVAVLGVVPAVVLCVLCRFLPLGRDLADPLGRPSTLSLSIINSAHQFDVITAELVPKHKTLSSSIQTLNPVAADLAKLTGGAGKLPGLALRLNNSTGDVARIARGLPGKIDILTTRSNTAAPTVVALTGSIAGVTGELQSVSNGLSTIKTSLATLGPKADGIARTLAVVKEEAAHVQEMGPLLALLGPAVNGPKTPAPQAKPSGR